MRKLTLLISMLFLSLGMAWAQTNSNGPLVTFTNVQKNGAEFVLYITDSGVLDFSTMSAAELGEAAQFRATKQSDGKWTFYNESKELYMIWRGNDSGYNSNTGVLDSHNATYCNWTVTSSSTLPGAYRFVSKRSNGSSDGTIVILSDGSRFDKYGDSDGYEDGHSNQFRIDVVDHFGFKPAKDYASINKWYYLTLNKFYLYNDGTSNEMYASKNAVDTDDKDAYTWAFIGNPFDGYKVANKKGGYLNCTNSGAIVGNEEHTFTLTVSTYHSPNGFFMAGEGKQRFNRNGNSGKLVYWSNADGGSTFNVVFRDDAADLQALIDNAKATLQNLVEGTTVGYVTADSKNNISDAISDAETAIQNGSGYDAAEAALKAAVSGVKTIQPEVGKYYTINSEFYKNEGIGEPIGLDVNVNKLIFNRNFNVSKWFQFVDAGNGQFYLYNVKSGLYLSSNGGHNSGQVSADATTTAGAKAVTITNMGNGNIVKIVPVGGAMIHAQAGNNVVAWNDEASNSASAWTIVEVENPGVAYIDDTNYATLQAAIEAWTEGKTINLLANTDETVVLPKGMKLDVINFNGFTAPNVNEAAAKIGDTLYASIEDALAYAQADETITLLADVTCAEKPVFKNGGVVNVDINGHVFESNERPRVRCVASADGADASNNIKFVRGFGWEAYNTDEKFRVFPTLDEAVAYKSGTNAASIYPYENVVQNDDVVLPTAQGTASRISSDRGYDITWDLNGNTVEQKTASGNPLEATVLGKFTLLDSSAEKTGKWIAGGCNTTSDPWNGGGGPAFLVKGDGELLLKGGTVSIARNTDANGNAIVNNNLVQINAGKLIVDGATLQCEDTYGIAAWGGNVVVNSGKFNIGSNNQHSILAVAHQAVGYAGSCSVEVNTAIDGYMAVYSGATATVNAAGVKYVADGTNTIAPAVGEGLIALDGQVYVPAVDVPENVVGNIVSNNSGNSNVTEDAVTAIVNNIYNNGAVIKYVPTNIPDGAKLVVELKNVIFESASTVPATVVYDVTPKKDGAKVEPENAITFRLPVPESWVGKYTKVYHAGTALEGMYPVQEGNYVEVASQDFSEFAVETVDYIVLPDGVNSSNYAELFGDNTVTDGTNYYATLQAAVEAVAGQANAVLYCKPGADVGSLQHAPVTSTLTVYGNGADVTGGAERDFDLGNTDPSGGNDITADMTLTVKHLNGCGAWGTKATEHTVNLVFENCANMGKVFISGTTGTLNITMTDCAFEGVINEAVYSNADGAIILTNVAFSNLNKAVNLNHKAAGTQTVTINDCTFTNCGADVAADQIPVRVLSSVEGGKSVLTVTGSTFTGTPDGGADILLDYGVGLTTASVSGTAANVVVEKENNVGTTTAVKAEETVEFTTALPVAQVGETKYMTLAEAVAAAQAGDEIVLLGDVELTESLVIAAGKEVVLDLNGKTVSMADASGKGAYAIKNNGNLTIVDNSDAKTGKITFNSTTPDNSFGYATSTIGNGGSLTVESGTIENTTVGGASYAIDGIWHTDEASLTITGGTIVANKIAVRQVPFSATANNVVTVNGGTLTGATAGLQLFNINNDAKLAEVNIHGGEFNGSYAFYTSFTSAAASEDVTINIDGGEFNGYLFLYNGKNGSDEYPMTVSVTGGTFNGGAYIYTTDANGDEVAIPSITGGTFVNDVTVYCVDGYLCEANGDGTYGVEEKVELPEVVITDIKDSLTDSDPDLTFALNFAIKDIENLTDEYLEKLFAQYGDWYTDYVLTISGLTDENVTFNANGNGDGYLAGQYDAWSENWVSVPFEDVTLANNESIYIMEYAAKLMNKQGLRFTLAEVAEIVQNFDCGVYFTPEFLAANPGMKVDLQLKVFTEDAEGNKVNDINVATNNFDVENYVAIVHADGKQTKYCTTLADAVAAATDGATVTMLSNVELTEAVKVVGKAITLDLNGKSVSGTCNSNQGHLIYIENGAGLTVKDGAANGGGKLTYAQGTSNVGWTVAVMGNLTLESGTIELTGSWNIGYAVDVRPNAWGVAYTAPSVFTMNGGNVVSSDGAVRVASSSSDTYADVSASFVMNGGKIDAAWDGVFIQQSNAAYDVLNFTINGGTIESDLNPVRVYGPAPTSYVNGQECMSINFNGGTMTYTGTETREWVIDGVLRVGGGSSIETIVENGNITAGEAFAQAQALPEGYIWEQDGETYKVVEAPKAPEVVDGKIEFVDGEFDMYTNDTDIEGVEITYKRTIDSDWNALYVPFAIPASELLADFDIAYINDVRETDADDDGELDGWQMELIKIKKETAVLRANHPYFVRSKSADYTENNLSLTLTTTLYKATVAEFECSSVYSTYTIKGLNELRASTEFGDADRVLGYDNGETTWGKMADGYSLKPFRFYLTITNHDGSPVVSSSAQMSIVVRDEDGTTGIDGIYGDENGETVIFDLYGRRVLEPEKGNIYIINGKKVLVK